ncbi:MAG: AAA family ATPase [Nitrosotalea sp.]
MKIRSIRISNILSFESNDDITKCESIQFDNDLNILIGPNGSGKSNFLEIINQLFRVVLFLECVFDEENIQRFKQNPVGLRLQNTLSVQQQRGFTLKKNYDGTNEIKQIEAEIELSDFDKSNLVFILNNIQTINRLFTEYTNSNPGFSVNGVNESLIKSKNTIVLRFDNKKTQSLLELSNNRLSDPVEMFIFLYFQWFEFIQNLITLANSELGTSWIPLKNTFAIIGSYRNFNQMDPNFVFEDNWTNQLANIKRMVRSDSTRVSNNTEPAIFLRIKSKIADALSKKELAMAKGGVQNPSGKSALELLQDPILDEINNLLREYLNLYLHVERSQQRKISYSFSFKDKTTNNPIEISDLSAGEKGIIHFIFSIFAPDLKDGLLIIDEPELHLHPQLQQKCLGIIKQAQSTLNLQCIIATHSPIFVTPDTIRAVYRFYKPDRYTKVVHPQTITASDKDLINILNYTNASKIFFVDKVVLVEGPSDEYFYKFFLDKYNSKVENIEFLDIGGKKGYSTWKDFLDKYGITVYFIGDLDNIFEIGFGIIDNITRVSLEQVFEKEPDIVTKMGQDPEYKGTREYRRDLLSHVRTRQVSEWQKIEPKIKTKYSDNVFILSEGELENYVDITGRRNKFEKLIEFCKNGFGTWYASANNKVQELKTIFSKI